MNEMTEQKDVSIPLLSDKLSPDETKDIQIKKTTDIPDYSNEDLYAKANCISRLLFIWGYKIIKLSHKTRLTAEKLGNLTGQNASNAFMNITYYVYNDLNYKSKKKFSLILAIIMI